MNDGLKQRIVGALVLIALGVIFVPVLFDKERIAPVNRVTQVPPEPDITVLPLPEPPVANIPAAEVNTRPIDGQFEVHEDQTEDELSASEPTTQETGQHEGNLDKSWVLQVASFSSEERANDMLKQLEKMNLRGFTRPSSSEYGKHTRVYVGPSLRKSDMVAAKEKLDKKFGFNTLVLNFRP